MLFTDTRRNVGGVQYGLSAASAVAALAQLRQHSFPGLIDAPRFIPRAQRLAPGLPWLAGLRQQLARQALFAAALAAAVLILATALPAWVSLRSEPASASATLRSSAGVTGTAATRVEDLSVTTFVGRIPFVQQARYLDSLTASKPAVQRFVEGARQAGLIEYVQDVSTQVVLPYLSDAVASKQAIDTWAAAVAEAERLAAIEAQRQAALQAAASHPAWQAPALADGTRLAATVTFYACIGNGFCDTMASGEQPFQGAAACSADLPFGTKFVIESDPLRRVFVCLDRGALAPTWVDIWFYDAADGWRWQSIVGTSSNITIVE